jgi:hypothetical protein
VSTNEQEEPSEPERSKSEGTQTSIGASTTKHRATQKEKEQKRNACIGHCQKEREQQLITQPKAKYYASSRYTNRTCLLVLDAAC